MANIPQLQELVETQSTIYKIKVKILEAVRAAFTEDIGDVEVELVTPVDTKFGDYTSNIALKIAKNIGKNPREVAEAIKLKLASMELKSGEIEFEKVEVAGPGFLNLTLPNKYFLNELEKVRELNIYYGKWNVGKGQVMVEFGQPNTHKAMTAGHIKSGVMGLSVSRLIRNLGFNVIQANYFSDIGLNTAKATWGFIKKGEPADFDSWAIEEKMKFVAECYVFAHKEFKDNEIIAEEIKNINKTIYTKSDENILTTYLKLKEISIEHQDKVFGSIGVTYDRQFRESEVVESGTKLVKENLGKIFIEDQGAIVLPGEKYGVNTWVFITSQGLPTYSAKDLGLANLKFAEYPSLSFSIMMTSTEQNDYFRGVIKALELIDNKFVGKYYFMGFGWLLRDNKKMSSKLGNAISVKDLFDDAFKFSREKIDADKKYTEQESTEISEKVVFAGLKFLFLSREFHIDINYDPAQFLNPEGFSGPYVLYAYVRAKSILRQALELENNSSSDSNHYEVNSDELKLVRLLSKFPQVTFDAGRLIAPHLIANYIFEVAQAFNSFYKNNKVLVDEIEQKNFRLKLVEAVGIVLKNGLNLLGIETIEKM